MAHYTIDERNAERQHLLAKILNPLTIPVLDRLPREGVRKILDLGCGQGNTTRLLAEQFPEAQVIGIEYDPNTVAYARSHAGNDRIRIEQGDATKLPFPDATFDLVFARYLLLHIPEPDHVIREMFRVLRTGGRAVSFEMDCCLDFSHPQNPGVSTMTRLFQGLFAQPFVGRQLVHRFRCGKPSNLQAGACLGMDHETDIYKRHYRLAAEALAPAAKAKGLLNEEETTTLLKDLTALEASAETITIKPPDFWVIATR